MVIVDGEELQPKKGPRHNRGPGKSTELHCLLQSRRDLEQCAFLRRVFAVLLRADDGEIKLAVLAEGHRRRLLKGQNLRRLYTLFAVRVASVQAVEAAIAGRHPGEVERVKLLCLRAVSEA